MLIRSKADDLADFEASTLTLTEPVINHGNVRTKTRTQAVEAEPNFDEEGLTKRKINLQTKEWESRCSPSMLNRTQSS